MATVHLGRLVGESGFSRTVAIKRLHPQLADAPDVATGLLDEARIVSRIRHPNVVPTLDLITSDEEVLLVMEYVHGESLSRLLRASRTAGEVAPMPIVASVLCGALHGLHAAHEARSEAGEPLGIVHRDVSPENLLVGVDGVTRLLDFGIAKAHGRLTTTRNGQLKGKVAYMAPEQILCAEVTRRTDVYAAGIVLWEALTGARLFEGEDEAAVMTAAFEAPIRPPSELAGHVPAAVDSLVLRALDRHVDGRFATARELAIALEDAIPLASPRQVGAWVERLATVALARRAARIASMESTSATAPPPRSGATPEEDDPGRWRASRAAKGDLVTRPEREASPPFSITPDLPAAPTSRLPRWLAAAALATLLLGAGVTRLLATPRPPAAPGPAEERLNVPVVTDPGVASTTPSPIPTLAPVAPPAPASAAAPSARPQVVSPSRSPQAITPITPAAKSCKPPYTVDANGARHLKPECI
jgi:serine/threonine-protein kinase